MESTPKIPTNNCDRVSNLPEHIIHRIFSFLETRDVIRASLVSRRWRYLWTSLPYLNFNIDTSSLFLFERASKEKFENFVNWVLMSQDGSTDIQRLQLCFFDFTIYSCINIAVRRNVQNLDLQIVTPIDLDCLIKCDSLVELTLCSYLRGCLCAVKLPSFVGFSRLKSLKLQRVELTDEVLAHNFISSCPLLENFSMEGCIFRGFKFLYPVLAKPDCFSTSFHTLKSLKLSMYLDERQMPSVINFLKWSPNLEALTICIKDAWNSDWKIPDEAITCLTYHLKMVELINVQGTENELDFLRFLLKNGHVLEILNTIWVRNVHNPGEIIQKVMKFQRSSSNVALKFLEPKLRILFFNL